MSQLGAEMASLAAQLQAEHPELDGSMSSLGHLERLVQAGGDAWSETLLRQLGAYLGEVIRHGHGQAEWVGYEAAASAKPSRRSGVKS